MIALFLSMQALAVTKFVTVCVEIETDFVDPTGDFWGENLPRPARGVQVVISDDNGSRTVNLGASGCSTLSITSMNLWSLTVRSRAVVSGIPVESYRQVLASDPWSVVVHPAVIGIGQNSVNVTIPTDQVWENLAIGMWALHRNTFGLGTGSTRSCCVDVGHPWYDPTGTCFYDPGEQPSGVPEAELYGPWDGDMLKFVDNQWHSCCGSTADDPATSQSTAIVSARAPIKFLIAHELGHVVAMKRIGDRELTNYDADLDDCMGSFSRIGGSPTQTLGNLTDYASDPADPNKNDIGVFDQKSILTKEYQSGAAREGWADFFAAWMWNDGDEPDCIFNGVVFNDFDLDGDIDDNFCSDPLDPACDPLDFSVEEPEFDGRFGCEGTPLEHPEITEPIATDLLRTRVTARDWLEDLDLSTDSYNGSDGSTAVMYNRAVEYDWMRYWWDMYTDEAIGIRELTDVYVDMCPRTWAEWGYSGLGDAAPAARLDASTTHNGVGAAHGRQKNNGVER